MNIFVGVFISKVVEKLADITLSRLARQKATKSLERMKRLSAKAFDVEAEIKNEERSGKKKRKRFVEAWLNDVRELEGEIEKLLPRLETEGFIRRFFGGGEATKLRERIDELFDESRDFGHLVLDVCGIPAVPFQLGELVGEKFAEYFTKIWEFLVVDRTSSIGIHGMGGVGKTTLARRIHNQLIESHKCVFWITVSQAFTIYNLQGQIARLVGLNLEDEHDEEIRALRLNQVLSQQSDFVLILDDVWKEINLQKLGDPLSVSGGKLIITTRSLEMCHQIGCNSVVRVTKLSIREAWDLFTMTFGEEMASLTPQIQEIAKIMVGKCGGLPLTIIAMAGCMKGKNDDHEWRNALEVLNELMMSGNEDGGKVFEIQPVISL